MIRSTHCSVLIKVKKDEGHVALSASEEQEFNVISTVSLFILVVCVELLLFIIFINRLIRFIFVSLLTKHISLKSVTLYLFGKFHWKSLSSTN